MFAELLAKLPPIGIQDFFDIALLAAVIYWLLQLIKGTRTIPILLGLSILVMAYVAASFLELDAVSWVMENLFSSAVIILVVLFQGEIRNALAQVGITAIFRDPTTTARITLIDEVVSAAFALAKKRIGASIVFENETGLRNIIERGKRIMAEPTAELLASIFHTSSPLHDGAVIINREGKLAAARCILPLTTARLPRGYLGTRHRSAIGLTEEADAVVVVVSEERGNVSLAHRGKLQLDLDEKDLRRKIAQILHGEKLDDAVSEIPAKAQTA
ncbi:MAG: TIGR00159 family protein [SAR324 cluster bacterium]|nr:TIGR00159 family protein [SAR324 cluster bacterium]